MTSGARALLPLPPPACCRALLAAFVSVSAVFIYFVVSFPNVALSAMDWQAVVLAAAMGIYVLEIVHMGSVLAFHLRLRAKTPVLQAPGLRV